MISIGGESEFAEFGHVVAVERIRLSRYRVPFATLNLSQPVDEARCYHDSLAG